MEDEPISWLKTELAIRMCVETNQVENAILLIVSLLELEKRPVNKHNVLKKLNECLIQAEKLPFDDDDFDISYQVLLNKNYIQPT